MVEHDSGGDGPVPRLAFIHSAWHEAIIDRCRDSFLERTAALGIAADHIDLYRVPGAFEIPLHAQRLASTGRYAAIVGAALVIDGGIYRHDFVADAVLNGMMRVQLDTGVPIISAVLTPHHFHAHEEHAAFFAAHLGTKGEEAADACAATIRSLGHLPVGSAA